jgi:hypothetical protein
VTGLRFVGTVVSAALLLVFVYLTVAVIVDGYFGGNIFPNALEPDAWSAPDSWGEWRDIVIVLFGLFWALAGLLSVALVAALVFLVITLRRILRENVAPAVDSAKATLDNARGTTEFVGETVASPIIRVYSIFSGIRGGIGALSDFPGRVRSRKGKKR